MGNAEVAQLDRAAAQPFAAPNATATAQTAKSDEERVVMVCAAATMAREDARKWTRIHEIRRSKDKRKELPHDTEKPRATGRVHNLGFRRQRDLRRNMC